MKEKKPKSDIEDTSLKPTNAGSMKKVKKKGCTLKCSYCRKRFNPEKKCLKKNMENILL